MQDSPRMTYKTFDEPIRILFWTIDEFLILIPLCFIGLILKSLFLICLAFTSKAFYAQMKKKRRHQSYSHFIYLYLPTAVCQKVGYFEGLPPSHLKEVILT